jgi:hypothetical protein
LNRLLAANDTDTQIMVSKVSGRAIDELPPPNCLSLSTDQYPERDRIEAAARQLDKIAAVKKLIFDSAEQPGDRRQRMEQWLEALSSGYVRLSANPTSDMHFHGRLKIVQLENASIGTIGGTVQSISRTVADVAIENTNNVVLLLTTVCMSSASSKKAEVRTVHREGQS